VGVAPFLPRTHLCPAPAAPLQRYSADMELEDAIHTALLTLREGFEGEMTATNIQLAVVGAEPRLQSAHGCGGRRLPGGSRVVP